MSSEEKLAEFLDDESKKKSKDDWELKQINDSYLDFNYWKVPDQYKIEDLMEDMNKDAWI